MLKYKNLWRLARARFFLDCSQVPPELHVLAESPDKSYSKVAQRMLQHTAVDSNDVPSMTFLRLNLSDPAREYCTYGHDHAASALATGVGGNKEKLREEEAVDELSKLIINDENNDL